MFKQISEKIKNMPLSKKIFVIVLVSIGILCVSVAISFALLMNANNRLLYRTVADSLSSSASFISDELENLDAASASMVLDTSLQQMLSTATDSPESVTSELNSTIYNTLESYFQQFRYNHLSYMILDNKNLLTQPYMHTYIRSSQKVSDHIYDDLVESAKGHQGSAVWITKYSNQYGLFLVREFRRIKGVRLDTLGTLIINLDTRSLLDNSSRHSGQYGDALFVLAQGDSIIQCSEGLTHSDAVKLKDELKDSYGVISLPHGKYFAVKNKIPSFEWDYYSLVPYNSVYNSILLAQILFFFCLFLSLLVVTRLSKYLINTIMVHFDTLIRKIKVFGENEAALPDFDILYDYSSRTDEFGMLHQKFDKMAYQIHDLIHVNYQNELLMKDAQIKALETQINPHFLYNTLESINWRAKSSGETEISQMVEALGYLLRGALSQKAKTFSIQQELDFVNCYLTIQMIRFDEQLVSSVKADKSLLSVQIPKLIIQPLVENAIHYALEEITEQCYIYINIFRDKNHICIEVKNSGSCFQSDLLKKLQSKQVKPNGFGIGLLNIDQRIKLTYGEPYGLELYNEKGFAVAKIVLPYPEETEGEKDYAENDNC